MSGFGSGWYNEKRNAIGFEPETDKDLDRLDEMLEDLRRSGNGWRISEVEHGLTRVYLIALGEKKGD